MVALRNVTFWCYAYSKEEFLNFALKTLLHFALILHFAGTLDMVTISIVYYTRSCGTRKMGAALQKAP